MELELKLLLKENFTWVLHLEVTLSFKKYASDKVKNWCDKIERLSNLATFQPQTTYAASIYRELHKYTYFMQTIPYMDTCLKHLMKSLQTFFANIDAIY